MIRWLQNLTLGFPSLQLIATLTALALVATGMPSAAFAGTAITSPRSGDERFVQARQLLAQGELGEALAAVKRGLASEPQSVEGLNLLGIILARQGRQQEALAAFESALKADPFSLETHNNLGDLYVGERRLRLAEREFRAALRLNPADRTANYNLGAILLSRHAAGEALRYLLRVTPADEATRFEVVEAYLKMNHTAKALALAQSLSEAEPHDVRLHFSLGILLASARQYGPAIHELELADALQPGNFGIVRALGECYLHQADYSKADQTFDRALSLQPNSVSTLYLQAQAYTHEKKILQAFQLLFRARRLAPKNTDVILLLARLSMQQSYYEDAIPLLEEGVRIAPDRGDLRAALGESYFAAGKTQKAYQEFQELLRIHPSASSDVFMGLYYRDVGELKRAQDYFTDGLKLDPRNTDCLYNLGLIAEKHGDHDVAETWLKKALAINPHFGDALFELATVEMQKREYARAIPLLRQCVAIDPNQPTAYYKLAIAEHNLQQTQAAERDLKIFETLAKNPSSVPVPFQRFLVSVSHKVSLPPEQQAQLDLRELSQEVKAHPDRPRSVYLLAQSYLKLGQVPEALATLSRLRDLSRGDMRTMIGAGVLLARYRIYTEAIKYFQAALAANPGSDDAKYDIADAYFGMRDYGQAFRWLQNMSPRSRNDPGALALLGGVDSHLGRLSEAEAIFRKAIQTSPDNDVYYLSLAMTQLQMGDLAGARQTLVQGQARIPDSGRLFWGMAVLSVVRGNDPRAEADFRRALDLMPEWESSYSALGTFYFETGQISSAERILDQYSQIFPHGALNVGMLRRLLASASQEKRPAVVSLSPQERSQFLQMALVLADSSS